MASAFIQLMDGTMFDLLNPRPELLNLRTIAHSLARVNRYTGHTLKTLSVAAHSIWVSIIAPADCKREALMHDAAESLTNDVAAPIKRLPQLAAFREEIEKPIEACIAHRFDLRYPWPEAVKKADGVMLGAEARRYMRGSLVENRAHWEPYISIPEPTPRLPEELVIGDEFITQAAFLRAAANLGIA